MIRLDGFSCSAAVEYNGDVYLLCEVNGKSVALLVDRVTGLGFFIRGFQVRSRLMKDVRGWEFADILGREVLGSLLGDYLAAVDMDYFAGKVVENSTESS